MGTSSGLVPAAVDSWQPLDHPIVEAAAAAQLRGCGL